MNKSKVDHPKTKEGIEPMKRWSQVENMIIKWKPAWWTKVSFLKFCGSTLQMNILCYFIPWKKIMVQSVLQQSIQFIIVINYYFWLYHQI